ncbi:MAG: response regulator transcription factor [Dehalococcoidales bacterium]|nr:response regulator transcription factor [Dehalococcoidales bacterium]
MLNIAVVAKQNNETIKLCSELTGHGFRCSIIDGENALEQIKKQTVSLLLVDFTGSQNVESLCRYLRREKGLPIIALAPQEKLDSMDGSVDDFIVKPYNTKELATRALRLIKKKADASDGQILAGDLTIDPNKYEVYVSGRLISLTFKEYELLKFLASHPGRVFTRDSLLNQVWSEDYFGGDRTVDVHIRRLRSKIEDQSHVFIETVRNIGYRFIKK